MGSVSIGRAGVGRRLGGSFLVLAVLIVVAAGAGWWGLAQQHRVQQRTQQLELVKDDVQLAKFYASDVTGWQGLVVADAGAFGYGYALGPDGYNRKGELADKKALYQVLDAAHTAYMTPTERAAWAQLRPAWDNFFVWDDTIMEWLRGDTQAARAKAMTSINGGEAAGAYTKVLDTAAQLQKSVDGRMAALRSEAARAERTSQWVLGVALVAALLMAVVLAIWATRSVVQPLGVVVRALGRLEQGDLTVQAGLDGSDELGRLGAALDNTAASLRTTISALAGHAGSLASASEELEQVSNQIATSAQDASVQANVVARAAEQVSGNVHSVSTGGGEMGESIREISSNASEAASVAAQAVSVAEETNATVAKLGVSSTEIGNVVKIITSIAEQTNLLALNATIEAARAGEAGKGFAVVAGEVKDLAQETAKATDDITRRVDTIQADTTNAVRAIEQIATIVGRISDYQNVIAAAVEEQSATTTEMNRNVAQAAHSSREIADNIAGVAQAAATTMAGVSQSQEATGELAQMSSALHALVARFQL
ncbi:MAG: methyl-accepting chemotaxis protein [Actinobacteria bacterium 13_2_20CM_2_71_6]|nr:MAG: methyl-accepting chemotaxis protein [Actinobacteria bacterium 13_2_20CM_2_71_6]